MTEQDRHTNAFCVKLDFTNGETKYLDAKASVQEEVHITSLIACYKAIVKFVAKHRARPIVLLDKGIDSVSCPIDENNWEYMGTLRILCYSAGKPEPEEIRVYGLLKSKSIIWLQPF